MDYLEILRNDAKLAEEFDMLFDFCLLDGLEERDTAEGDAHSLYLAKPLLVMVPVANIIN